MSSTPGDGPHGRGVGEGIAWGGLLALVALLVAVGGPPAQASPLSLGGTLTIRLGDLPPAALVASESVSVTVSSGSGSFTEPASVFGPETFAVSLLTGVPLISAYTLFGLANGAQSFDGAAGTATGGLAGTAHLNIQQLFDLVIPLSPVGRPGASARATIGAVHVTVIGQGWTTGVASVTGITRTTPSGMVVHTATLEGSEGRTPAHEGSLVLVSGFQVLSNAAATIPGFAVQTLSFIPEPGSLLQIAAAALALAGLARRTAKSRP
jgi:hypothetical protein